MSRTTSTAAGAAESVGLIGPMEDAWAQTFQSGIEKALSPCLIIVWHSEWLNPYYKLWAQLRSKLATLSDGEKVSILVVIFGDTPDTLGEEEAGNPLKVLLRALVEEAAPTAVRQTGWASISDVARFKDAAVMWTMNQTAALVKLAQVCAPMSDWPSGGPQEIAVSLAQFFHFIADPVRFSASIMHATTNREEERQRLGDLKWLVTLAQISRSLRLRILVVENSPKDVSEKNAAAGRRYKGEKPSPPFTASPLNYLPRADFYVIDTEFDTLEVESHERIVARKVTSECWDDPHSWENEEGKTPVPWAEIDLILQDVMLEPDGGRITGLTLVPLYFERCPQALVFLLTGLDIESLVVAGDVNWRHVDAVLPKDHLENLWFEYRRCFRERFGRMFWHPWIEAEERKETPSLDDRQSLRNLFGCLRRWQLEPAIIEHGQGVQEMIDHAHRHVSEVWRLADNVLGTFLDNCMPRAIMDAEGMPCGEYLSVPERVLFAMSVWLHDIGHRGDDFLTDPGDVRANHAGISEYLLLRNPAAFGVEWLKTTLCRGHCKRSTEGTVGNLLLECRNSLYCLQDPARDLCAIRKLGLLCRHHQSNAPLDERSLQRMSAKGKAPSPYSRVAVTSDPKLKLTSQSELATWMNPDVPLTGWQGSEVRRLDQFALGKHAESLLSFAGLLRMLDALQLHRSRVGTPTSIKSFNAYLNARTEWCRQEIRRTEDLIRTASPGTRVYQEHASEYMRLRRYERLLNVQYVHYWRQVAVNDVVVKWVWLSHGTAALRIEYRMDDNGLDSIAEMKPTVSGLQEHMDLESVLERQINALCEDRTIKGWMKDANRQPLKVIEGKNRLRLWAIQVRDDVILSEHNSQQHGEKGESPWYSYVRFLPNDINFEVATSGRISMPLPAGAEVLLLEHKDFLEDKDVT